MTSELMKQPERTRRTIAGTIVTVIVAILCVIYMLNLTFGFDLIPDNLPVVGNLDEGLIMILLLVALILKITWNILSTNFL